MEDPHEMSSSIHKGRPDIRRLITMLGTCLLLMAIFIVAYFELFWYKYCYFKFGPASVYNGDMLGFAGDNTIEALHHDACTHDTNSQAEHSKDVMEAFCPDLCSNLDDIQTAMILANIAAGLDLLTVIGFILLIFALLIPVRTKRGCYFVFWQLASVFLFGFQLCTLLAYIFAGGWNDFDSTHDEPSKYKSLTLLDSNFKKQDPHDVDWEAGYVLAIVLLIVQAGASIGYIIWAIPFWKHFK